MDRNLFIAVALSVAIYVGWFSFINKRYGPPRNLPVAAQTARPETAATPAAASPAETPKGAGLDGALPIRFQALSMQVQPMGASLVSFQYPGPLGPVELVTQPVPGFLATWPELRFKPSGGSAFEARHPSGVLIRKEFVFADPGKLHRLRLSFTNPGSAEAVIGDWNIALGPGLGTVSSEEKENARLWSAIALLPPAEGKKADRLVRTKLKDAEAVHPGPWKWMGLNNRYFLIALFPPAESFTSYQTGTFAHGKERAPWLKAQPKPVVVPARGVATIEVPFYFGPKSYTQLKGLDLGLERSVDFGWFDSLGRMTLRVLRFLHARTDNWGWSIILLTIMLQTLLFPLTYKSLKSAAMMKKLQPELAFVQQKFGKDPQRLNAEMMQLYKKHGANPLGGCLPMLAQMPVFVALFNTLRNAWELHGAPWMFWVKDLSAHDPFYILPLVMGAIMFVQNKLNPAPTADPAQAQVMTFMPIIFTFMFLKFPAGLVLYWLTNSILSFVQQMALKKRLAA